MKEFFAERCNLVPVTPYTHACLKRIYGLFCAHIYAHICKKMVIYLGIKTHKVGKNASIRGKKMHVYRVAGMIASIHGKKPHVYCVLIWKQIADHS